MDRDQIKTKRILGNYHKKLKDFSNQAGNALAERNTKEVMLAYVNGTRMIKEVQSQYIVYLKEDEHAEICKAIAQEYTNLQGIYNVLRNPDLVNTFEVRGLFPEDDSKLEKFIGDE